MSESCYQMQGWTVSKAQEKVIDAIIHGLTEECNYSQYSLVDKLLDSIDQIIKVSKYFDVKSFDSVESSLVKMMKDPKQVLMLSMLTYRQWYEAQGDMVVTLSNG